MKSTKLILNALVLASFVLSSLVSNLGFAELPLSVMIDSTAGRYIFSDVKRGSEIATKLLGVEVAAAERGAALNTALGRSEMRNLSTQMEARLNRVRERFAQKFPGASDELFGASARALTREEAEYLTRLVYQELDQSFVRQLPERIGGATGSFAGARDAFVHGGSAPVAASQEPFAKLQAWAASPTVETTLATTAFRAYEDLRAAHPSIEAMHPKQNVYRMLADEEQLTYVENFKLVLEKATALSSGTVEERLQQALREVLTDKVPAKTISSRIAALKLGSMTALQRAMGDMTLKEAQVLLHGGNPLAPTADSLLGKYIAETQAATVVRTFSKGGPTAVAGDGQGPARLVVALSQQTMPTFLKYFSGKNLLGHLHTPHQGTLMILHGAATGSYASMRNGALRITGEGTMIPMIVLKTTEGDRLAQYLKLGAKSQLARYPWEIPGEGGAYCATGGYNSCTHWFGDIPIGDKLVTEYKFPGMIDNYASNRMPPTPEPRIQPLRSYAHADPLVQRVWKFPGNQQLGATLGLEAQNLGGELANPGWVAVSLTGPASVDRVPVVFRMVTDERAAIPADFPTMISTQ